MVTVHAPLLWLSHMKDTNSHLTRWHLTLQPCYFAVKYRWGSEHANADYFSRQTVLASLYRQAPSKGCVGELHPNPTITPHPSPPKQQPPWAKWRKGKGLAVGAHLQDHTSRLCRGSFESVSHPSRPQKRHLSDQRRQLGGVKKEKR